MWTAHGVKLLPANVDMSIRKEGKISLPASPPFLELVDDIALGELTSRLRKIQHNQYEIAECVLRDVRRIPLKPEGVDEIEVKHLSLSSDGLRFFHPVALYPHNCQSASGLIAALSQVSKMQNFISADAKSYTVLNVDVSLYNMLMHVCYGVAGMQPILNNVFFLFGIWHCYLYVHTAIWDRFRSTFLADAFFALFPNTLLMRKPKLFKSSVFFTWLRISYLNFREELRETLDDLKIRYLAEDRKWPRDEKKTCSIESLFCSLFKFVYNV